MSEASANSTQLLMLQVQLLIVVLALISISVRIKDLTDVLRKTPVEIPHAVEGTLHER